MALLPRDMHLNPETFIQQPRTLPMFNLTVGPSPGTNTVTMNSFQTISFHPSV